MHGIMSFINNPSALYAIGLMAVCILVVLLALSVLYYHRAKNLVPYLHRIKDLIEHIGILKNRIGEAQKTIQQLNEEYDSKLVDIAQAKQVIAEKENAESWLADNALKVEGLKSELTVLEQTCRDIKDKADERKKELSDLIQEIANKTFERDTIVKEKDALAIEKSRIEVEKTSLETTRAKCEEKIAALSQEIDALTKSRNELDVQIRDFDQKRVELISIKEQLKLLEDEIRNGNKKLQEIEDKERRLSAEVQNAEKQLQQLLDQSDKLSSDISVMTDRRNELHAEVQDYEHKCEELSQIKQDLGNLKNEITHADKELKQLRETTDAVAAKKNGLDAEVEYLASQKNLFEKQTNKLSDEINSMTTKRNELHAEVQGLENKRIECKKLEEQTDELRQEVARLQGERDFATKQISEWERIHKDNQDKWANLEIPVFDGISARAAKPVSEKQWLDDFSDKLSQNGLKFNERSIMAFHTGLKCADISPLVVLAGISGTGKSLLPELYAAAAGMNFLPVAVQPRWDSPQDLFGFYNYMEGRYKATELSRLLWQYDIFNNENVPMCLAKSLPMNIVMLDEMNLARVEYYFSDLLSKLETRHGINIDNDDMRRKAEIELDCNASMSTDGVRRLFVNSNTLFVGTMNEDESTQTLSDKVIDRSNVLRFGRPETLDARPDKSAFIQLWENKPMIDFHEWTNWCAKNTKNLETMKRILDPVNPVLDRIQRPFAHRVHQAMELYVQLYPGDVLSAIADQIEMKILPKLNGVELDAVGFSEVKDVLRNAIDQTGDERLSDAFDIACDENRSSFFKWHGVMR